MVPSEILTDDGVLGPLDHLGEMAQGDVIKWQLGHRDDLLAGG